MFSKILIANRGEIAVRIIRACKEMGISTVAVFSEADRDALHVSLADESICIGPAQVQDSYLNMTAILSAAEATGAGAIHPGYGLLSENAKFAALCEECHIVFIGPSSKVISEMGDKDAARKTMIAAGVPVVPGCEMVEDLAKAHEEADRIGYPLLVKARAGGGGRGIRRVDRSEDFEDAFRSASQEAQLAFGDGGVYLEKFVAPAKHIEMQLLCDRQGNVITLGERECSIQRKNQKMIEESPSPAVTPELRQKMAEAAVKAAKAVGYTGVGTIEFLLDPDKNFYFMEMNTRIQVEHPVTEAVTDLDLIREQIRIAAGERLSFSQEDVAIRGHAIECRINAENPEKHFMPCPGKITNVHLPGGRCVRVDTAIYSGYTVPAHYDSMLLKLIVWDKDRPSAIAKMRSALGELVIEGIDTNIDFQFEILGSRDYVEGNVSTDFIPAHFPQLAE